MDCVLESAVLCQRMRICMDLFYVDSWRMIVWYIILCGWSNKQFSKWHQAAWASRFCLHYRIAGCSCPRKIGKFYCLTLCVLCATQTSFLQATAPYGTSIHFMGVALAMSTTMAHVLMPKITSCCKTGALAEYILACGVQHEMCRDVPGLKAKTPCKCVGITQWRKEVRLWIKLRRKMLELILNSSWLPFWCRSGAFRRRSWAFSSSSIHPGCKKRWWFWFEKSCKLGMGTGCLWHTPGAATSHHLFRSCSTNGESVLLNYIQLLNVFEHV